MLGAQPLLGKTTEILPELDLDQIHRSSLQILDQVGVELHGELGRDRLAAYSGVRLDGTRVFLSPEFVQWVVEQAPPGYILCAQNPQYDIALGQGNVYYSSGFSATFVVDRAQRVFRPASLHDVARYLQLADLLENAHLLLTPFVPQDLEPARAEIGAAMLQFLVTGKHIGIGVANADCLDLLDRIGGEIARACERPGPIYSLGATVNSPLAFTDTMQRKIIFAAEHAIPMRIVSGAIAGATAPVTLAGALAMQNAEVLAGIALAQAVNPGCPVIYGTFVGGMDMRSGKWASGAPETALISAASAQLCQRYGIPLAYGTGGMSDSHIPDVRAGFEKGLSMLANALARVEVIHNGVSGLLAGGMAISLEQLVIDNEIAHWVNRYLRGISVDEAHLAFEVIRQVEPGGAFIDHEHTAQYCRQEQLVRPLLKREYQMDWPAACDGPMLGQTSKWIDETLADRRIPSPPQSVLAPMRDGLFELFGDHALYDRIMNLIDHQKGSEP